MDAVSPIIIVAVAIRVVLAFALFIRAMGNFRGGSSNTRIDIGLLQTAVALLLITSAYEMAGKL